MPAASRSSYVYVTFIRTTPKKLWKALTDPAVMRKYWLGASAKSTWKKGAPWTLSYADGTVTDTGTIVESDPPRRLVIRWQNEFRPELKAEGPGLCTMTLEPMGRAVKLTVLHEIEKRNSKLITAVSGGWPIVLSNLKSLLETGEVVVTKR